MPRQGERGCLGKGLMGGMFLENVASRNREREYGSIGWLRKNKGKSNRGLNRHRSMGVNGRR